MKYSTQFLTLILGSLLLSFFLRPASALGMGSTGGGFMIGISAAKLDESYDGATLGTSENTRTRLDAKLGYAMPSGLYVGGLYDSRTDDIGGSKTERTGYGATVGYHSMGWFLDGTFFLSSQYKTSSGTKIEGGTGFGLDLGKNWDVVTNVYLGLQLSYRSLAYTKVDGAEISNKLKSELSPMINLGLMF